MAQTRRKSISRRNGSARARGKPRQLGGGKGRGRGDQLFRTYRATHAELTRRAAGPKVVIRFAEADELKALPVLFRCTVGIALPGRTYVIDEESARLLDQAGIRFQTIAREGAIAGQRV